jgi:cytochrome c-type biogenesis protein CcmH
MPYFKHIAALMLLVTALCVQAAADHYPFASEQQQANFDQLLHELRCLVCQNQDLADSNAPLALDLKAEIYGLLQQGQSKQQVLAYMTKRYGDFVRYKPPFKPETYILWLLPYLLLGIGLLGLIFMVYKRQQEVKP